MKRIIYVVGLVMLITTTCQASYRGRLQGMMMAANSCSMPSAPTGISSTVTSSSYTPSATVGAGGTSMVERHGTSTGSYGSWSAWASGTAITGLTASTTYYYQIGSVNVCGTTPSAEQTATTSGGGGSFATPTHINTVSAYPNNVVTITGVTSGNFLSLVTIGNGGTSIPATTTGSTTAWTSAGTYTNSSETIAIFWAFATGAGTVTVDVGGTIGDPGVVISEYSGVSSTSPQVGTIQGDHGADESDTTFSTPTIEATQTNILMVAVWSSEASDRTVTASDWVNRSDDTTHIHKTYDRILTDASGSYGFSGTLNAGQAENAVAFVMYKAAGL